MTIFTRRTFARAFLIGAVSLLARPAHALIYLPENTLESMLLRSDTILIATVADLNPTTNRGTLTPEDTLKGNAAPSAVPIAGVMLQVETNVQKPRFAKGDRIVIFLGPLNSTTGTRPVIHSQTLASDAEIRTMKACIAEITPIAQLLTDLGDLKKEIHPELLHPALLQMVESKNAYTQIILGRLLSTRLATRLKPDGMEDLLTPALQSKRKELATGALAWTAKFNQFSPTLRTTLEKAIANSDDPDFKKSATALLK